MTEAVRLAIVIMLCVAALAGCGGTPRARTAADGAQASADAGTGAGEPARAAQLSVEQLLEVASVLEQAGDTVRAEQYLSAALQTGADDARVIPRLLRLYVADGQYRLAIDHAEHHLRRHPRDRALRLFVAALHAAVGADAPAIAHYERALRDQPGNAEAHYALAALLHHGGREPGRADEHFRAYLALEPRGHYAEEARALLLTEMP